MEPEDRLRAFEELVLAWAPRLDLVSPSDLGRIRQRHLEDSLRGLTVLDGLPPGPCVDVGSGAGFPGIPLAVMRPERKWRLVEPRKRRAAFLEEAVRTLELDCEVVPETAEQALRRPGWAGGHSLAIARALAPPDRALEMLLPFVGVGGAAVAYVGRDAHVSAAEVSEGLAIVRLPEGRPRN